MVCSIGSLGKDGAYNTVEEVNVSNCTFTRTQNGARIKTWQVKKGSENINTSFITNFSCD